jgi:hypothetical protein
VKVVDSPLQLRFDEAAQRDESGDQRSADENPEQKAP